MDSKASAPRRTVVRVHPSAARGITLVAACLLGLAVTRECRAQAAEPPARRYENPEYLFSVRYPLGRPIERSSGPGPNHGFNVEVAPGTSAWVFAGYPESASTLAEAVAEQRDVFRACALTEQESGVLGSQPAAQLTFECPAKAPGHQPNTLKLLLTMRTPPGRSPVVYEVGLQHPKGSRSAPNAERVYRTLAEGFSFTESTDAAAGRR